MNSAGWETIGNRVTEDQSIRGVRAAIKDVDPAEAARIGRLVFPEEQST